MDFKTLSQIDVSKWVEKKNGLSYLSWANAWQKFVEVYPTATYTIKTDLNGVPAFGNNKMGYMCYTTVTVEELTHEMWLPVMDHRNKSILEPNMFDVNKTVMRCLTKNLAMFGLGLYIYAGEDLPESDTNTPIPPPKANTGQNTQSSGTISDAQAKRLFAIMNASGKTKEEVVSYTSLKFNKISSRELAPKEYEQLCNWMEGK